ncbi:hypothetical protein COLO4_25523 [Corchorus olitorius]|uniref:Embryo surrounding factor 1 brassicaceae domain-containing protein n=1 Tax=Corchorus olitorius TaxID=93759 RepID=A0A1R3I1Z2_9ROSI|nr:hypothetical protein COLO4_25523 [Corchorus olitorius]
MAAHLALVLFAMASLVVVSQCSRDSSSISSFGVEKKISDVVKQIKLGPCILHPGCNGKGIPGNFDCWCCEGAPQLECWFTTQECLQKCT